MSSSVTIYDIARKAKVSYATASRVLNGKNYGKRSDSMARAQKVLEVAAQEGYQPNSSAQALVGKSTKNICLLISDHVQSGWSNAYFAQVLEGVERACHEHNFGLVLNRYTTDDFEDFFLSRKLGCRSFDGIVVAGYVTPEMHAKFKQYNIPFISTNKHFDNIDNVPAYYTHGSEFEIARYAYNNGHRNIGFIAENIYPDFIYINEKVKGAGLTDCNIVPLAIDVPGDFNCGPAVMEAYFALAPKDRPTLIGGNYQTCAALLKEIGKHGLSCPEDLSLISRCESEVCQMVSPELTVISPNNEKIGEATTEKLISFIDKRHPLKYESSGLDNIIIERQSVKNINERN